MIIYDSTNPFDIPLTAEAVAGYGDGAYAWSDVGWRRFAGRSLITIVVSAADDGDALDVETGDATPDQVPGWVQRQRVRGLDKPWVYVNRSNRPAVENAMIAARILSDQVLLWVATLDGTQSVPAGPYPIAAVQYANSTISGGHYDLSITTAYGDASGTLVQPEDAITVFYLLHDPATQAIYAYHPVFGKRLLSAAEWSFLSGKGQTYTDMADTDLKAIPDAHQASTNTVFPTKILLSGSLA